MACTPPATPATGFAFLDYNTQGGLQSHRSRFRLQQGIGPQDLAVIGAEMDIVGDDFANVLPNNGAVTGWGTMNPDGSEFYSEAFTPAKPGAHADATGAEDFNSRTVTLTGKGTPAAAGTCGGQTRVVIFVGKAFNFAVGQKHIQAGVDTFLDDLALRLQSSAVIWADFWGQPASVRSRYTVQYNASTQRRKGT